MNALLNTPFPVKKSDDGGLLYVVALLSGAAYALSVEHVTEVIKGVALTPVPKAHRWLLGAFNLRGNILPVIDIRELMGVAASPAEQPSCLLILKSESTAWATPVERVENVIAVKSADWKLLTGKSASCKAVASLASGQPVTLLDTPYLFSQIRKALS